MVMSDLRLIIAQNIIFLRKEHSLTQMELADLLNYSDKAVSKWERGESIPDITVLKQIADFFHVTVDYLLEENHPQNEPIFIEAEPSPCIQKNRKIITALAVSLVWLITTILFVSLQTALPSLRGTWKIFVYSVPVVSVVTLIFNSIWGNRKNNYWIISVLIWSILVSLYLLFYEHQIWLIFVLGIPAEIIIYLWSRLNFEKDEKHQLPHFMEKGSLSISKKHREKTNNDLKK